MSGPVTFQKGGTYFWQAVYGGDSNNLPATSSCTSEQLTVIGPCVLGYPDHSHDPRSSVTFSESAVLRAFSTFGSGTSTQIAAWYSDEHALLLGVRSVNGTPYPVTTMTTDPDHAVNPATGAKISDGAHDPSGRTFYPALYVTDITNNTTLRTGDWQQTGLDGASPNDVFGTWKSATETNGVTTVDADPVKNTSFGNGADTPPAGISYEAYRTEVRWNASALGLQSGHAYRLEFMVHDGDQNKRGGDAGEACANVVIP